MKAALFVSALVLFMVVASTEHMALAAPAEQAASVEILEFGQIWKRIESHSPAAQAAERQVEAARIRADRTARIWYPRVYAEMRSYRTDDPAMSFVSILGQREINSADFNPDRLNHPDAQTVTRTSLGVNLALYEGGARSAVKDMNAKSAEAKGLESRAVRSRQYGESAKLYALLLSAERESKALGDMLAALDAIISRYQVGSRANPVGYSGLLGMKSLKNRLLGLADANRAKTASLKDALTQLMGGDGEKRWRPETSTSLEFLRRTLAVGDVEKEGREASAGVKALRVAAEAGALGAEAEMARFLPQVGLFGETALTNGSRATAGGSTVGVYLQWSLFNGEDHGAVREARTQAAAANSYAEAMAEKERIERGVSKEAIGAGVKALGLIEENESLMTEQTNMMRGLFQNGSISALQFVEVLARRVDLIEARTRTESSVVDSYLALYLAGEFPAVAPSGGLKP
jgi:outer membrane protein TolC